MECRDRLRDRLNSRRRCRLNPSTKSNVNLVSMVVEGRAGRGRGQDDDGTLGVKELEVCLSTMRKTILGVHNLLSYTVERLVRCDAMDDNQRETTVDRTLEARGKRTRETRVLAKRRL